MSVNEEKVDIPSCEALEEAIGYMKKAYDIMKQQALDVRKEKEAFESVAKKLENVHFASTIDLNVGGLHFTTSLKTLTKDTGSMLNAMFSGRFDTKPAKDGSYFIDRDGTHFRYILNYLRTGNLLLPDDKLMRKELLEEAEFYQIRGIVDELFPQPFSGSKILSNEQKQVFVNTWLEEQLNVRHATFVLLYRASRDGFAAARFHALCDNQGPTITVVKSGNSVFGGYTEQSWDVSGAYKHCTESFLFSLVNPGGVEPTKLPIKADTAQNGIYCHPSYGPTFGGGNDLYISSEANVNSNSYTTGLGNTYQCPAHITPSTFFTGNQKFVVNDLEVFVYRANLS